MNKPQQELYFGEQTALEVQAVLDHAQADIQRLLKTERQNYFSDYDRRIKELVDGWTEQREELSEELTAILDGYQVEINRLIQQNNQVLSQLSQYIENKGQILDESVARFSGLSKEVKQQLSDDLELLDHQLQQTQWTKDELDTSIHGVVSRRGYKTVLKYGVLTALGGGVVSGLIVLVVLKLV